MDFARIAQQAPAALREPHAFDVAQEQGIAGFGFQLADLGGYCGLGKVQQAGGSGYLATLGHDQEGFQPAGIQCDG